MLSAAGFEKNKLFRYLLDYISKKDAEFIATLPAPIPKDISKPVWNPIKALWEEATEDNEKDIPKLVFSLDTMRDELSTIEVGQIEHFLLFIFLRKKIDTFSEDVKKNLITDWNNVSTFKHTHSTIAGDIQHYIRFGEQAIALWQEFEDYSKDIPILDLHEICLFDSTKNMDGTYCYYVNQIGMMGNHIIMTNMIKELTKRERVLKYISKNTTNKDIKKFINIAQEFIDTGLSEKYDNTMALLIDMLKDLKSWLLDPTFIFYDYATRVPADVVVIQPNTALKVYKDVFEKEENK